MKDAWGFCKKKSSGKPHVLFWIEPTTIFYDNITLLSYMSVHYIRQISSDSGKGSRKRSQSDAKYFDRFRSCCKIKHFGEMTDCIN